MAITVAILRSAGCSPEQIVRILELEHEAEAELEAEKREENRIRCRAYRQHNKARVKLENTNDSNNRDQNDQSRPGRTRSQDEPAFDFIEENPVPRAPTHAHASAPTHENLSLQKESSEKRKIQDSRVCDRSAQGTRLPPDWQPATDHIEFAMGLGLTLAEAHAAADEFRDYWVGVPGQRGRKVDWLATWRNRIRETIARKKRPQFQRASDKPPRPGSREDRQERTWHALQRLKELSEPSPPADEPGRSRQDRETNNQLFPFHPRAFRT